MPPPPTAHPSEDGRRATLAGMPDSETSRARALVAGARRITVLTGAGISTDSGIPDFRGPQGVWTRNPAAERTATLENYLNDPDVRRQAWQTRLASPAWAAQPNAGHLALVQLERQGRLRALVTQNIDELHQRAGHDPALVLELHGTMWRVRCWSCGEEGPMEPVLDRVRAGDDDPHCEECGGILKSATISFGQALDPDVLAAPRRPPPTATCSLPWAPPWPSIPPPAWCRWPTGTGRGVVIVNAQPTPYDDLAAAVVRVPISEVLPSLVTPAG